MRISRPHVYARQNRKITKGRLKIIKMGQKGRRRKEFLKQINLPAMVQPEEIRLFVAKPTYNLVLTDAEKDSIRLHKTPGGKWEILVYQEDTTEMRYARNEGSIADKLAALFRTRVEVQHHRREAKIDDGFTVDGRLRKIGELVGAKPERLRP
jgi:hypothetical protein